MSNNKKKPTSINAEVHAKASADLEEAISRELSIEDEEKEATAATEGLFSGGTPFGGDDPPHTILGMPIEDCETRGGSKKNESSA